jgi:hypothetical protein
VHRVQLVKAANVDPAWLSGVDLHLAAVRQLEQ